MRWGVDEELVAVGIARDIQAGLRGRDEHAERCVRVVPKLVRARLALGERDEVARLEGALSVRRAKRRRAGDDDEELLAPELPVVRPELLARRRLVDRGAEQLGPERCANLRAAVAIAGPLLLGVESAVEQVEVVAQFSPS